MCTDKRIPKTTTFATSVLYTNPFSKGPCCKKMLDHNAIYFEAADTTLTDCSRSACIKKVEDKAKLLKAVCKALPKDKGKACEMAVDALTYELKEICKACKNP